MYVARSFTILPGLKVVSSRLTRRGDLPNGATSNNPARAQACCVEFVEIEIEWLGRTVERKPGLPEINRWRLDII